MMSSPRHPTRLRAALSLACVLGLAALLAGACTPAADVESPSAEGEQGEREVSEERETEERETTTVRAHVQMRPGGPTEEVEMEVHPVPVDPPTVAADDADLGDDELVLGVVVEGQPMAFPIRYLALTEVANTRVADTPLTPTW